MRPMSPFLVLAVSTLPFAAAATELPDAIAAPGEAPVMTVQAIGAQVYECKADAAGGLAWQFREPIATLLAAGKTVGRHYAGPGWEMTDGSAIVGKVAGRAAAASPNDIPLLKLEVTAWRGTGQIANVTTIQRINTKGGVAGGSCDSAGAFMGVPYTADYAFLSKERLSLQTQDEAYSLASRPKD